MKQILLAIAVIASTFTFGQTIKVTSEKVTFSVGTQEAIVVNIPFGLKESIEKELRSEMKAWGGKSENSNDEYISKGAKMKAMGDKYFDGYAKIIQNGDQFSVAFLVDLGGAYMNGKEHPDQFKVIEARAVKFAQTASKASVKNQMKDEEKILKDLEKEQKGFESSIEKSQSSIEDYNKKIKEEENNISKNKEALDKKKQEVEAQKTKIADFKKKTK